MGDESYFIDALCDRLASTILGEAERSFNQIVLYGRDTEPGQVINFCRQMPMMGSYEVVILKEAQQMAADREALALHAEAAGVDDPRRLPQGEERRQAFGLLQAGGRLRRGLRVGAAARLRDRAVAVGIHRLERVPYRREGAVDADRPLGMRRVEDRQRTRKLLVSLPEGTQRITDRDIERNIGISREYNNFELCKAVLGRDMARALRIADHFGRNPKENPLLVTVLALFGQFRQLFVLNYLYWLARRRGTGAPSDAELMRALKVGNVFAINELRQAMPRWPNNKVFGVLGLLREYDGKSKGLDAGGASDGELLRELLLKMLTI